MPWLFSAHRRYWSNFFAEQQGSSRYEIRVNPMNAAEAARLLGVTPQAVHNFSKTDRC